MNPARRQSGFTLVEMLVAISIAAIMFFLINELFNSTQRAVSQGMAVSDIITNTRSAETMLQRDARFMVGPHDVNRDDATGGVLVILQHAIDPASGVQIRRGPRGNAQTPDRPIRSDQLMFIRTRENEYPMTPSNANTFTPFNDNGTARYLRVWYGHVSRTNADGSNPGNLLGQGPERLANDWILGRQALFIGEGGETPPIRAIGGWVNAQVQNVPGNVNNLYMGTADYARFSMFDPNEPNGCMVGADTTTGEQAGIRLAASRNLNGYRTVAVENYTFAGARLRVNPFPGNDNYESWQIAQMHPYFMEHVSDFVVEFAGDYTTGVTGNNAALIPDGELDQHIPFSNGIDSHGRSYAEIEAGGIKWYTHPAYANNPNLPATYDSRKPLTFAVPTAATHPFYAPASYNNASAAFVWRHDDHNDRPDFGGDPNLLVANLNQSSWWPYLIRIRYRMHDSRGQIESGDGQHGMWFEHVIRVRRP